MRVKWWEEEKKKSVRKAIEEHLAWASWEGSSAEAHAEENLDLLLKNSPAHKREYHMWLNTVYEEISTV